MQAKKRTFVVFTCGTVAAIVIAGAATLVIPRPAVATPQFAADTKLACGACHTNPQGGGALTAVGEKFKANGNKMP